MGISSFLFGSDNEDERPDHEWEIELLDSYFYDGYEFDHEEETLTALFKQESRQVCTKCGEEQAGPCRYGSGKSYDPGRSERKRLVFDADGVVTSVPEDRKDS